MQAHEIAAVPAQLRAYDRLLALDDLLGFIHHEALGISDKLLGELFPVWSVLAQSFECA